MMKLSLPTQSFCEPHTEMTAQNFSFETSTLCYKVVNSLVNKDLKTNELRKYAEV